MESLLKIKSYTVIGVHLYHTNLISTTKTLKSIEETVNVTKTEKINLENGNSRVLAHEIKVLVNVPPFNRSAMDGYAVISDDISQASTSKPKYLRVVDEISAGTISKHVLKSGEAIRIATGAQMPTGSDTVIMEEDVESTDDEITIMSPVTFNKDVSLVGEDMKMDDVILSKGQILGPHHLAVIASAGYSEITVFKKPEVGIIITGNELTEPSMDLKPGMIINSNKYALKGVVEDSMANVHITQCPDDIDQLTDHIKEAVLKYDAVITTGGTAISKGDLIVEVVDRLGDVLIHGVSIKPGKPFGFGIIDHTPIFMLSGYPVAVAVQYDIFVRSHIMKMQNINKKIKLIKTVVGSDLRSSKDKYNVIRANFKEDSNVVYPLKTKAGINKSILMSNCYIIAEEGIGKIRKGEECMVLKYSSLKVC